MAYIMKRGQGSSPPPELPDVADAMKPERLKHRVEPRASWTELPVAEMPERDDVKQKDSGLCHGRAHPKAVNARNQQAWVPEEAKPPATAFG